MERLPWASASKVEDKPATLSRKFSWRVGSALRPKQHAERRRSDLVESIRRQRELVAAEREAERDASIAPSTPTSHGLT